MKIILLQDVAKIGRRHDVVEVPDGYARNQLIPKRMAEPATTVNLKRVQKMSADKTASNEASTKAFKAAIGIIKVTPVTITVEANEKGHLFKAVSSKDVAVAAQAVGAMVTEDMITFKSPIKEVGDHSITLKHLDQEAVITIKVNQKN